MNKKEQEILTAFTQIPFMTGKMVANLGIYSPTSKKFVLGALKSLTEDFGYLDRAKVHDYPIEPFIYYLGASGRKVLHAEGYDFTSWPYPSDMKTFIASSHFPHALQVSGLAVCCYAIRNNHPIEHLLHDFHLKRIMQGAPLIPDLLVKFASGKALWFEWDNGTEEPNQLEAKIRRLCELMKVWDDWFDTPIEQFTFCFLTPISEERARLLLKVVQNELFHNARKHVAQQFRFAYIPKVSTADVFFNPIWFTPYSGKTSLLEV